MAELAQICPECGSAETQTEVRTIKCLACGAQTPYGQLPGDEER